MIDKFRTRDLLFERKYDEICMKAIEERSAFREVMKQLYAEEMVIRHRAAIILGMLAKQAPHLVRSLPSRLMWALNDESGMSCHGAAAGIAEIAVGSREIGGSFVTPLIHFLDDEGHLAEVLWAIRRLTEYYPNEVAEVSALIERFIFHDDPNIRGMAIRALAGIGGLSRNDIIFILSNDKNEIEFVENGEIIRTTIGQLVIDEVLALR